VGAELETRSGLSWANFRRSVAVVAAALAARRDAAAFSAASADAEAMRADIRRTLSATAPGGSAEEEQRTAAGLRLSAPASALHGACAVRNTNDIGEAETGRAKLGSTGDNDAVTPQTVCVPHTGRMRYVLRCRYSHPPRVAAMHALGRSGARLALRPPPAASHLSALQTRALYTWLQRLAGVSQRDSVIAELRAEAASTLESLGDLQARRRSPPPHPAPLTAPRRLSLRAPAAS